uniref:Uncharacterized protein n=1 Tax=Setaria digitata TaxID=48799 RepID=A0A915Q5B4_9BILA
MENFHFSVEGCIRWWCGGDCYRRGKEGGRGRGRGHYSDRGYARIRARKLEQERE